MNRKLTLQKLSQIESFEQRDPRAFDFADQRRLLQILVMDLIWPVMADDGTHPGRARGVPAISSAVEIRRRGRHSDSRKEHGSKLIETRI